MFRQGTKRHSVLVFQRKTRQASAAAGAATARPACRRRPAHSARRQDRPDKARPEPPERESEQPAAAETGGPASRRPADTAPAGRRDACRRKAGGDRRIPRADQDGAVPGAPLVADSAYSPCCVALGTGSLVCPMSTGID